MRNRRDRTDFLLIELLLKDVIIRKNKRIANKMKDKGIKSMKAVFAESISNKVYPVFLQWVIIPLMIKCIRKSQRMPTQNFN